LITYSQNVTSTITISLTRCNQSKKPSKYFKLTRKTSRN